MLLLRTEEAGPKISDSDVAALEKKLRTPLPPGYRDFLLVHNGGRPIPAGFPLMLHGSLQPWRVHFFFKIRSAVESTDIDYNLQLTKHTRPKGVIPIASDEGGSRIYLGIGPENYNQVFFGAMPRAGGIVRLTPIASRFEEFLSSLEDFDALTSRLSGAPRSVPDSEGAKTSLPTFDQLAAEAAELGERTIIMPIDEIRLSAAFAALADQEMVVGRLIRELFNHQNMHVRRIGVNAARRSQAFRTSGLKEALTARLFDPEAWVQYDAAWAIAEAGFDSPDIRERLASIAGDMTVPEGEARVKADLGNSKLQAQLRARKTLDSLLTVRH